jgi:kynurenine formamidase
MPSGLGGTPIDNAEPRAAFRIVDLSLDVYPGAPAFPGDPACEFAANDTIATTGYNLTRICLGTHQGTHLDAPSHFLDGGRTVDRLDLGRCVGPATVIDLSSKKPGEEITVADFAPYADSIQPGARIIYRLGWDRVYPEPRYYSDFPGMTAELAEWLASRRIALIGMDSPSPHPTLWTEVHVPLLAAEVVIVEGLARLDQLPPEIFFDAAPGCST